MYAAQAHHVFSYLVHRTPRDAADALSRSVAQTEKYYLEHAPAPQNGCYYLYNVGAGKYLDVKDGKTEEGTPIVGWKLEVPSANNERWHVVGQTPHGYLCTLQSVHSNGFMRPLSDREGSHIIQSQTPVVWELIPHGKNTFKIHYLAAAHCSVLSLPHPTSTNTPEVMPEVTLEMEEPGDHNQLWCFQSAPTGPPYPYLS